MKRTGKIARLPFDTRQKLNIRLLDNEPGDALVAWLNARPEVQAVLREQFDGHPITPQNLSEWRTGGFAVWELRQEVFGDTLAAEETSDELDAVTNCRLVDKLCTVLAGRYASLLVHWDGEITPAFNQKLRALHILCRDLMMLRREARGAGREAAKPKIQPATGVATVRRHVEAHIPKNAPESDPVAPHRTNFRPNSETGASVDVATSCRHPEGETGKGEGRGKDEELGKSPGTSDGSGPVAPGKTTLASNIVTSVLADLATGGHQPKPLRKPLQHPSAEYRDAILAVVRSKNAPGQPALAVLPD